MALFSHGSEHERENPERIIMNVNGITTYGDSYSTYQSNPAAETKTVANEATTDTAASETGVVYEPTLEMPTQRYKANEELINKLKADAQNRIDQLQNIVTQLITKQSNAFANANDMWSILREGNFTVDAATKAQAQEDISENGYWGVNQTSDRIVDFAMALTGGDPNKVDKMIDAFKKGYAQAEKTWGGELPEISKKTYEAVLEKFEKIKADNAASVTETTV